MKYSAIETVCRESGSPCVRGSAIAPYTSMKIGGECDLFCEPSGEDALRAVLRACRSEGIPYFILGRGSNVLFSGNGFRGCIVHIGKMLGGISAAGDIVTAGAGESLSAVCLAALERGLSGMEFAYGIPGSVGGALYMNAGAYGGEMKDVVTSCRCIRADGSIADIPAEEMKLRYRGSIFSEGGYVILSVSFKLCKGDREAIKARMDDLMSRRREKQPLEYPSCGSTFKRPEGYFAAALIEECGLKGCSVGGAQVSEKHSGFVINKGGATFEDVTALVEHIKKTVLERKGVALECEMLIVPERAEQTGASE